MKQKIFSFIILINILSFATAQTSRTNSVIGVVYANIANVKGFEKFKEYEGIAIEPLTTKTGFSKISDGKNTMILFTRHVFPSSQKILAVLDLGELEKNVEISMARCRVNTKEDGNIIAIVRPSGKPYFKNIIKVWRADEKTHKFVSISIKGIDCLNDGADTD